MYIQNHVLIQVVNSEIKNGTFVIPEGVTTIGYSAFNGCISLTTIVIPKSVTTISTLAFRGCTSLKSIVIPEGVKTIGSLAFGGCTSLSLIVIPKGVTAIGDRAFESCTNLKSIVIPKSVAAIGARAFYGCISLESIVTPESVTTINADAFIGRTSLSIIHIDADTQEEYERILKLLPQTLQQTIQANIQVVVQKAGLFIASADKGHGFFNQHEMPCELTAKIVAGLAEQYKIPLFMITKELDALRSPKETTETIKEQLNEIKASDSAEANDENRNDGGGMRNI